MDKKGASYNVDMDILAEFNRIADEKAINKSKWIEKKMLEFIKENNQEG
jgi:hypothetical protein